MLLFDAHLDLSMNAVEWNRDFTRQLDEVRQRESGLTDKLDRGKGVITLDEMRRGEIGICVATQIARYVAPDNPLPGWNSPEIAWSITQAQLAWYREMERVGQMVQIVDREGLDRHLELWRDPPDGAPIGYILSLEGADSIVTVGHLERAYEYGLRALGPAHYGAGRYSPGTGSEGGLEPPARELLQEMARLNIVLDATHLTDEAFWEVLELWDGPIWASHNNCRALVPHQRQFSDDQLKALIERDAVIGMAYDAWMMQPNWVRGVTDPRETGVNIARSLMHIDHICQLAGNTRHVGIGSDLDGGFGREQCPYDLESIADLQSLTTLLADRGYANDDIEAIMHGNWIRRLREIWS
ncbi:MAG: membrane dipeptidase [Pirellulaceae bacterium]|jgi:membrane dipeptidase|nr:membrane dipeptidase [Pirellulaceae bacterium]MDP7014178.1 membrane dipeptidase [Pirellulaceae bacterium]